MYPGGSPVFLVAFRTAREKREGFRIDHARPTKKLPEKIHRKGKACGRYCLPRGLRQLLYPEVAADTNDTWRVESFWQHRTTVWRQKPPRATENGSVPNNLLSPTQILSCCLLGAPASRTHEILRITVGKPSALIDGKPEPSAPRIPRTYVSYPTYRKSLEGLVAPVRRLRTILKHGRGTGVFLGLGDQIVCVAHAAAPPLGLFLRVVPSGTILCPMSNATM